MTALHHMRGLGEWGGLASLTQRFLGSISALRKQKLWDEHHIARAYSAYEKLRTARPSTAPSTAPRTGPLAPTGHLYVSNRVIDREAKGKRPIGTQE